VQVVTLAGDGCTAWTLVAKDLDENIEPIGDFINTRAKRLRF
jgi:hypothetical protein